MGKTLITSAQASLLTGYSDEYLRKKVAAFKISLGNGKKILHLFDEEDIRGMKKKVPKNVETQLSALVSEAGTENWA